ncbi:MAG TPA: hypothetical protein VIR57_12355 [Chloroflexota bacterium]|jgi:hypothetical protein
MFATLEAAAAQAQRPGYVAHLEIPTHDDIRVEKTLGPHHYSVWGDPKLLLTFVRALHPLHLPHG